MEKSWQFKELWNAAPSALARHVLAFSSFSALLLGVCIRVPKCFKLPNPEPEKNESSRLGLKALRTSRSLLELRAREKTKGLRPPFDLPTYPFRNQFHQAQDAGAKPQPQNATPHDPAPQSAERVPHTLFCLMSHF